MSGMVTNGTNFLRKAKGLKVEALQKKAKTCGQKMIAHKMKFLN